MRKYRILEDNKHLKSIKSIQEISSTFHLPYFRQELEHLPKHYMHGYIEDNTYTICLITSSTRQYHTHKSITNLLH